VRCRQTGLQGQVPENAGPAKTASEKEFIITVTADRFSLHARACLHPLPGEGLNSTTTYIHTMNTSIRTRIAAATLALTMPIALVSCGGDSPEKITADSIALMGKLGDALGGITDKASAEAAVEKVKALTSEIKDLKARMDKVGKPSAEVEKQLEEKFKPQLEAAQKKMMEGFTKAAAAGPEAMQSLQSAMMEFKSLAD
jgi:hypothetical protein